MNTTFPPLRSAGNLRPNGSRLFIGAYGFEDRSLGWPSRQPKRDRVLEDAVVFKYKHPKGNNKVQELRDELGKLGVKKTRDIVCDVRYPYPIEDLLEAEFQELTYDEIVLDITAMTKLLILACLCKLRAFKGTLRLVYSEARIYSPSKHEFEAAVKKGMAVLTKFPSRGAESIVRLRCLSSIRMQGQPVILVAFTSFNEQLVRHMLGTMSPHRLMFINGRPPRTESAWREHATQKIHERLIDEFAADNPKFKGLLERVASTLDYRETIDRINSVYDTHGNFERIICAATGSKMQTVGLFFSKTNHPDVHVEYPTPDSYFVKGFSEDIRKVHEVTFTRFSEFIAAQSGISPAAAGEPADNGIGDCRQAR